MQLQLAVHHIVLLAVGLLARTKAGFWRFWSASGSSDVFSVRESVILEYVGAPGVIFITWSSEKPCSIMNASCQTAFLSCPEPGIHQITANATWIQGNMTINEISSKVIEFGDDYSCYSWYIRYYKHRSSNAINIRFTMRVWIIDPIYSDAKEMNKTAARPAQYSSILTRQFYLMGQQPQVSLTLRNANRGYIVDCMLERFNETGSYWLFYAEVVSAHIRSSSAFTVTGRPITFYDCFIRDTVIKIVGLKFPKLHQAPESMVSLSGAANVFTIVQDPCFADVALAVAGGKVYITQDGFTSIQPLPAPHGYSRPIEVDDIVLTTNYVVLLSGGELWLLYENSTTFSRLYGNVSLINTQQMSSHHWCISDLTGTAMEDAVAFWNKTTVQFLSFGSKNTVFSLPMDMLQDLAGRGTSIKAEVVDVHLDVLPRRVWVAMKLDFANRSKVLFGCFDVESQFWSLSQFWMDYRSRGIESVKFLPLNSATASFFFYNARTIFYSYDNGNSFGAKKLYMCNVSQVAIDPDHIEDIIFSYRGDLSIELSSNEILYSTKRATEVVKLDVPSSTNASSSAHWFSELGQLFIVTFQSPNGIKKIPVSIRQQIKDVLGWAAVCQYQYFHHNSTDQTYYLDMHESLNLHATIVYSNSKPNSIEVIISEGDSLSVQVYVTKLYYRDTVSEKHQVTFSSNHVFASGPDYEQQRAALSKNLVFELRPAYADLMCDTQSGVVGYISVGCPPKRRIQPQWSRVGCDRGFQNFTIPSGSYVNRTTRTVGAVPQEAVYDWDSLGCPIEIGDGVTFLPLFDLYDEFVWVRNMAADYVLWEVNGRIDFLYCNTMFQAGCVMQAQSWSTMMSAANATDTLSSWGPNNYRSCLVRGGANSQLPAADQPYEVLNGLGTNCIQLLADTDAIYVFTAVVVDPDYSFCNLSTTFALRKTVEVIENNSVAIYITNGFSVFVFTIITIFTYVWFHKHMSKTVKPRAADEPKSDDDDILGPAANDS